jgi:hypothetical protein
MEKMQGNLCAVVDLLLRGKIFIISRKTHKRVRYLSRIFRERVGDNVGKHCLNIDCFEL